MITHGIEFNFSDLLFTHTLVLMEIMLGECYWILSTPLQKSDQSKCTEIGVLSNF